MQSSKIILIGFSITLYFSSVYADAVYMSVIGMGSGSSLIQMDEALKVVDSTSLKGANIISLNTTSHDKEYIYGIDNTGLFAFDTQKHAFIYRFSQQDDIYPTWMYAASPSIKTKEEWLHIVNSFYPDVERARQTLIALEKRFFAGDKEAKSALYDFEDYHWEGRVIEGIVADPKDDQHFFLVLSGTDITTKIRERDLIEMRFNLIEKRYELIKAVPLTTVPDTSNRVRKIIISPNGRWIYVQFNTLSNFMVMVDTKNLKQYQQILSSNPLEDIALAEDGKTLMVTYRYTSQIGGLKTFIQVDDPKKIKEKADSPTPTFDYKVYPYSYDHERILTNPINQYVPTYFALSNLPGVSGNLESYYNILGTVSTVKVNSNGNIHRGDAASLISEQDENIQECVRTENYCLTGGIAHAYAKKHQLYTAKTFLKPDNSSGVLMSKIHLENPEVIDYILMTEGLGRLTYPTSILIIPKQHN